MTKYCFILLQILFSLKATAADSFLVYHVSKQVHWLHDGKKENARRGIFIIEKQSIVVLAQSDIMLVENTGKSLLLDKAGTYTFLQIKALFLKLKTDGVSKNFFAYVFEKFLSGNGGEEKQKVAAAVFRSKQLMSSPADSSFITDTAIVLRWNPDIKNLPCRITINFGNNRFDTIIKNQSFLLLPKKYFSNQTTSLLQWTAVPYDSKQTPPPFLHIVLSVNDKKIIQRQFKEFKEASGGNRQLFRTFEKDLFTQWISAIFQRQ